MGFNIESELMVNQKHAKVVAPDRSFEAVQSSTGARLFSLGADSMLYMTYEERSLTARHRRTGWDRRDLSSDLSSRHGGAALTVKSFAVSQAPQSFYFDIAMVVTVAGTDWLYLSLDNPEEWGDISWTAAPFNAADITTPSHLSIISIYLLRIPSHDGKTETVAIFADVKRDSSQDLERYYIQPDSSPTWHTHPLATDLSAESLVSCIGKRAKDRVPGIYTFGKINNVQQLIFTPQYNAFRRHVPPQSTRLLLPGGSTAIASALNSSGATNLFVMDAYGGMYVFTPNNQGDLASPTRVAGKEVLVNVSVLYASTAGSRTALLGVNGEGNLWYTSCREGQETDSSSWSPPMPLCKAVDFFTFYVNHDAGNFVLFAHHEGRRLIQHIQDPVTSTWVHRSIMLPTTNIDDVVEYHSYTTHIQVTDDRGFVADQASVVLTSTSPVTAHINDEYRTLSRDTPITVTADENGTVTVVQEAHSLGAVCFRVALKGAESTFADVDPMSRAIKTLKTIQNGADLGSVQITTADGTTKPLVPLSISTSDRDKAASALRQLMQISSTLPADGSRKASASVRASRLDAPDFFVVAGDLLHWLRHQWDEVADYVLKEVEGAWRIAITIGVYVYEAVIDSLSAVTGTVGFLFRKLEVPFEDLMAWLGFLFRWDDIIRTHRVMKNVLKLHAQHAVKELDTLETAVHRAFDGLEGKVNGWAGIADPGQTIGQRSQSCIQIPGGNSPQSHWALFHTKYHIGDAQIPYSEPTKPSGIDDKVQDINSLRSDTEVDNLKAMIGKVRTQVVDPIATLTATEVIQKLGAIVSDLVFKTAEKVLVKPVELLKLLGSNLITVIDATTSVPILSRMYKSMTGDDLTLLDVICLVGAIPATIVFMLASGQVPYPPDSTTEALINAPDFETLVKVLSGSQQEMGRAITKSKTRIEITSAVFNIAALFGSGLTAFFSGMKFALGSNAPAWCRWGSNVSFLLVVAPNFPNAWGISQGWEADMNNALVHMAIVKTWADNYSRFDNMVWSVYVSPWLEMIINAALLPPLFCSALANKNPKTSDWLSYSANIIADFGGIIAPGTVKEYVGTDAATFFFVAQEIHLLTYGGLSLGTGIAILQE